MQTLFNAKEKLILDSVEDFTKSMTKSEKDIYNYIVSNLASILTLDKGKVVLTDNFLTEDLENFYKVVADALKKNNYVSYVDLLISRTPEIDALNQKIYSLTNKNVSGINKVFENNNIKKAQQGLIDKMIYSLRGDGVRQGLLAPLGDILTNTASNKLSYDFLLKSLENSLFESGQNILGQWSSSTAREGLFGYSRGVNQAVKVEYKLNGHLYAGGLIATSRQICIDLVNLERFKDDVLAAKIDKYKNPSTGLLYGKFTTVENFHNNCGGANCLHESYPIRID